jgi:hypothetical protein
MNQLEIFEKPAKKNVDSRNWELPDAKYLHECFIGDFDLGILAFKPRPAHHFKKLSHMKAHHTKHAGRVVTRLSHKGKATDTVCVSVMLDGVNLKVHRVLWKMKYGVDPKNLIDHKNGDRLNNSTSNLRDFTYKENAGNTKNSRAKLSNYSNYQMAFT